MRFLTHGRWLLLHDVGSYGCYCRELLHAPLTQLGAASVFMLMIDSNEFSRAVAKVSWCQALNVEMCVYVCEKIGF